MWVYLHAGGALGADGPIPGVETELDSNLARYIFPDPPRDPDARRTAIRASLRMFDLAPVGISGPGYVYVFRSAVFHVSYALGYYGRSGAGKSPMQACLQQHYGATMIYPFAPAFWFYTENVLNDLQYQARDALLPIDDFVPAGPRSDQDRMHGKSARVVRGQANRASRRRMRRDGTLAPDRPPRGGTMWTGETALRGEPLQVRSLTLACYRGMMQKADLDACRRDANAGRYAETLGLFIQWVIPRRDQILAEWDDAVAVLQARLEATGHPRTPQILADLAHTWNLVLDFMVDMDAITAAERETYRQRFWKALEEIGGEQSEAIASSEVAGRSIRLLSAAVASAQLHFVTQKELGRPHPPERYGWREQESESKDDEGRHTVRTEWRAGGKQVGYIGEHDEIYLESEIAFVATQRLADSEGEGLGITIGVWKKRLNEGGFLAATHKDGEKVHLEVLRVVGGKRRPVLYIRADAWNLPDPAAPEQQQKLDLNSSRLYNGEKVVKVAQRPAAPDSTTRIAEPPGAPLPPDDEEVAQQVAHQNTMENKAETPKEPLSPLSGESRGGNLIPPIEAGSKSPSVTKSGLFPRFYFLGNQLKFPEVTTPDGVHVRAGEQRWRAFYQAGRTTLAMVQAVITMIEPLYQAKRQQL
jgi:hypothetical protein